MVALKVVLRPAKGEIIVDGDLEEIRAFMEWYLKKAQTNQQTDPLEKQDRKPKQRATPKRPSRPLAKPTVVEQQPSQQIDTSGLPSFVKDNPWLNILSARQ